MNIKYIRFDTRESSLPENDIIYTYNPNFLKHGHIDIFVANNIVFIPIKDFHQKLIPIGYFVLMKNIHH